MERNKSLIVTVAINYSRDQLKIFVESIIRNCPNSEILFFCDNKVKSDINKFYGKHTSKFKFKVIDIFSILRIKNIFLFKYFLRGAILLIRFNNFFSSKKNIHRINLEKLRILKYSILNSHFLVRRFIWYLNIKKDFLKNYKYIILSDCRDVFFQKDPFEGINKKKDFIISGCESEKIKNNNINKNWIKSAYYNQPQIYKKISDSSIVCAGVTLGTKKLIFDYLKRIKIEIVEYIITKNASSITNLDQAFHNKIFSFDNIKGYYLDRDDNFISTMGFYKKIDYKIDYENKKIYVNGKFPSIIHQYDRDKNLQNTLDNWYSN